MEFDDGIDYRDELNSQTRHLFETMNLIGVDLVIHNESMTCPVIKIMPAHTLLRYFSTLSTGKTVLWCYLIWYFVTVANYFDPALAIWLNALGISGVIGVALMLSVGSPGARKADRWVTFRLFFMPFAVSSFSSLIKGHGFILIFPPRLPELLTAASLCGAFILLVFLLKRFNAEARS